MLHYAISAGLAGPATEYLEINVYDTAMPVICQVL